MFYLLFLVGSGSGRFNLNWIRIRQKGSDPAVSGSATLHTSTPFHVTRPCRLKVLKPGTVNAKVMKDLILLLMRFKIALFSCYERFDFVTLKLVL